MARTSRTSRKYSSDPRFHAARNCGSSPKLNTCTLQAMTCPANSSSFGIAWDWMKQPRATCTHGAKAEAPAPRSRASRYRPEQPASPVSSAERPSILDEPAWRPDHRSTDRRPIESLILGSGQSRIAVVSSLHGDETQSVSLVEELARFLRRNPEYLRQ